MHELVAERWPNTFCWAAGPEEELLFYIASWRVPQPIPRRIRVRIYENGEARQHGLDTSGQESGHPAEVDRSAAIVVRLTRKQVEDGCVRFEPEGKPSTWPMGSLAVPAGLLEDSKIRDLNVAIDWQ